MEVRARSVDIHMGAPARQVFVQQEVHPFMDSLPGFGVAHIPQEPDEQLHNGNDVNSLPFFSLAYVLELIWASFTIESIGVPSSLRNSSNKNPKYLYTLCLIILYVIKC